MERRLEGRKFQKKPTEQLQKVSLSNEIETKIRNWSVRLN